MFDSKAVNQKVRNGERGKEKTLQDAIQGFNAKYKKAIQKKRRKNESQEDKIYLALQDLELEGLQGDKETGQYQEKQSGKSGNFNGGNKRSQYKKQEMLPGIEEKKTRFKNSSFEYCKSSKYQIRQSQENYSKEDKSSKVNKSLKLSFEKEIKQKEKKPKKQRGNNNKNYDYQENYTHQIQKETKFPQLKGSQ